MIRLDARRPVHFCDGMTRRDFLDLLQKQGVPFAGYSEEDWEEEQRTLREIEAKFLGEQRGKGGDLSGV